jgi:hypothetical protein
MDLWEYLPENSNPLPEIVRAPILLRAPDTKLTFRFFVFVFANNRAQATTIGPNSVLTQMN